MKDQYIEDAEKIKLSQRIEKIDRRQNRIIFILFALLILTLAALVYVSLFTLI